MSTTWWAQQGKKIVITVLAADAETTAATLEDVNTAVNLANGGWLLAATAMVLLMTPALALFYGGMSRQKSVLNMMMMSFSAIGITAIVWTLWGWSLAFGPTDIGGIIANPFEQFALAGVIAEDGSFPAGGNGYPAIIDVAFQATFAMITLALVSGAIAERVKFRTWIIFAILWITLVYAPMAHMVWGGGFFSDSENGLAAMIFGATDGAANVAPVDFAGGAVVEINSGAAALALVIIIGSRIGFKNTVYRPHNLPFVMIGAGILWFGWLAFNAASSYAAGGLAGMVMINTLLAGSAGMFSWIAFERVRDGHPTSFGAASGIVAGLVAITPSCGSVEPIGAILVGIGAGLVSAFAVNMKHKLGFDDSLDVVGVHMISGLWGTIAIGLFATGTFGTDAGLFYDASGWKLLVVQIALSLAAMIFSFGVTILIALALKPLGWRVSEADEKQGIDEAEHAETAYDTAGGLFR